MDDFINFLTQLGTSVGLQILFGLLVLIVGLKLSKLIIKLICKSKSFHKIDPSVQSFFTSFLKVVLYALVISSTAMIWGVPATSFITLFASAGVTVGLALQGALSNFAGGLMILLFKPFRVGYFIESSGIAGVVKEISVIYTTLTTPDNKEITIPNGSLTNSHVINYSKEPVRRVEITIGAAYSADSSKVKEVLIKAASETPLILETPAPESYIMNFGPSSVEYVLRAWCAGTDYWAVFFALNENVKKAFEQNGISIPFPQMDVHLDK